MATPLEQLGAMGQSPWCDSISRHFIASGALQDLIDRGIRGVTVNPTIFERALAAGGEYDQEEEIDCTGCLERVPVYVHRELAGADATSEMPELHLHLAQCGDCFEEYEALRDLVALDASGGLPDKATLLKRLAAR